MASSLSAITSHNDNNMWCFFLPLQQQHSATESYKESVSKGY